MFARNRVAGALAVALGMAFTQTPSVAAAQGGVALKVGASYGTASNTGAAPGATKRSGVAAGVAFTSPSLIGLGVEAMYAQRGFTSTNPDDSRRLDYVDVPVTLRVNIPLAVMTPFAYAGPQGSYELQCDTDNGTCPGSGRARLTYAGIIGAGVKLSMLGGLLVEGRYVYGLSDLKLSTVQSSESYKTRSLLLLAGLSF